MTIDSAIRIERGSAKNHRESETKNCDIYKYRDKVHTSLAEYHEQLAEWLEELKEARKGFEENRKAGYKHGYSDGYNKAIEDVMEKAREIQEEQIKNLAHSPRRNGKSWSIYMNTYLGHIQVACKRLLAEQLKAGGNNE